MEEDYDPNAVYDMLENAETSFPQLKVARSTKFLKRRDSQIENNYPPPVSQTPQAKKMGSFLPPINQGQNNSISSRMMEQKRNKLNNFSRSVDKPVDRPNNNGVGYYKGPQGPNVVVTKISQQQQPPPEQNQQLFQPKPIELSENQRYLRNVHSQQQLQKQSPIIQETQQDRNDESISQAGGIKRKASIILKPKDNKPYLLIKTTRQKEEEKQKNSLGSVLHPHASQSQPLLKYHRAFKSVVDMIPTNKTNESFDGSLKSADDSRSLDRSEISMYNTDNLNVKHIYTTKSLILNRFKNSPYVNSPKKAQQLEKPWRTNMNNSLHVTNNKKNANANGSNNNFVEYGQQKKFLNNLNQEINQMNSNHIQSMKRPIGIPVAKAIKKNV